MGSWSWGPLTLSSITSPRSHWLRRAVGWPLTWYPTRMGIILYDVSHTLNQQPLYVVMFSKVDQGMEVRVAPLTITPITHLGNLCFLPYNWKRCESVVLVPRRGNTSTEGYRKKPTEHWAICGCCPSLWNPCVKKPADKERNYYIGRESCLSRWEGGSEVGR